ncbi:MAG: PilZ domain-containing protein [Proteobacteria bacterium]|nr:PilZ domain-containing protein [Pseudomonadota bacterium]
MSTVQIPRESESKKPSKRFTKPGMHVQARTIGTKILFNMPVENVSATGMLISQNEGQKAPFNINTILELEVAPPKHNSSNKRVQCLGKVIHATKAADGSARFGIKIIQSEDDEQQVWNQIILGMEMTADAT